MCLAPFSPSVTAYAVPPSSSEEGLFVLQLLMRQSPLFNYFPYSLDKPMRYLCIATISFVIDGLSL